MKFPVYRARRTRESSNLRRMVRENRLSVDNLVMPLFVVEGREIKKEISSMPGNYQMSVDIVVDEAKEIFDLGIPAVLLFGIPDTKDAVGSSGCIANGIVQRAVRAIKKACPEGIVITDVCLCEYTDHGHCGIVNGNSIDNDKTLELLAKQAVSHAEAGADIIAPSDMMDGRVAKIREALDEKSFYNIPIMSYAAKYASAFYGPFRDAAESAPKFGDRRSHQMDPSNALEAIREARLDIEEGADIIMVKPALPYLDIIYRIRETFDLPIAAYNVSGEFSMVHAAAERGWVDLERVMMESVLSIKRAGADIIITYFAKDIAKKLKG